MTEHSSNFVMYNEARYYVKKGASVCLLIQSEKTQIIEERAKTNIKESG